MTEDMGEHLRILVVEDEPLLSMLLEEHIDELGHIVAASVSTVDQAMNALDAALPDCALLDYSLSGDSTSAPVAHRLREAGVPFTYLSGHADLSHDDRAPPGPTLQKPYSLDQLQKAIAGMHP